MLCFKIGYLIKPEQHSVSYFAVRPLSMQVITDLDNPGLKKLEWSDELEPVHLHIFVSGYTALLQQVDSSNAVGSPDGTHAHVSPLLKPLQQMGPNPESSPLARQHYPLLLISPLQQLLTSFGVVPSRIQRQKFWSWVNYEQELVIHSESTPHGEPTGIREQYVPSL